MRSQLLYPLFTSITRLKGVGPAMGKTLARVLPAREGLPIVRDLVFHLPVGLIDRRATYPLYMIPPGGTATYVVTVASHAPSAPGRRTPYRVRCTNDTGDITLVFFNASEEYIRQALPTGEKRVISGQVESFDGRLQMTHPDIIAPVSQLEKIQAIEPVYPLTAGLTNRKLAGMIQAALATLPELPEWINAAMGKEHGWLPWRETMQTVHAPHEEADLLLLSPHRQRLAYDEILAHQLYLALIRRAMQQREEHIPVHSTNALREALRARLPFTLTAGQVQAIADIDADMASGRRMVRLLQGDVGSGKTVVALLSMLAAVECGMQAALMVPTELIAGQHAETIRALTAGLPVETVLLTGSVKGKTREAALSDIACGHAHIIIGTHALFQEDVAFNRLALIVIDEQHRFGVAQRMALAAKGLHPHLLHMTATPIPRSLMMTLYGDMDCTLLTEKPAGRKPVTTRVVPASRFDEMMQAMRRALDKGEKLYWICPQIEDNSPVAGDDVAAAEARLRTFTAAFGPAVGLAHGRMKAEARDETMRRFAQGDLKLLVATTVVEVGVDVQDATIMIVEQAERFGLSQLHQLRGRVGRSDLNSACVLMYSDGAGQEALKRLSILRETDDGFRLADEDLKLRGGGDLLGTRQSGLPQFRFVDLAIHQPLIHRAREEAQRLLAANPALAGEEGEALKILLGLFGYEYAY